MSSDAFDPSEGRDEIARIAGLVVPILRRYFDRRCFDASESEDLVQHTFVSILKSPQRLAETTNPRAYVLRCAHNRLVDHRRARRPLPHDPESVSACVDPRPSLTYGIRSAALRDAVARCVTLLPDDLRVALERDCGCT